MKCVELYSIPDYSSLAAINPLQGSTVFDCINKGNTVVLKPNWVAVGHKNRPEEWEQVITHPDLITYVLNIVIRKLEGHGRIIITDGPETYASFEMILSRYPVMMWKELVSGTGITVEIIDLREDEWLKDKGVTIGRKKLPGDPKGSTEVNLQGNSSEFFGHPRSRRGYYGADYDSDETNRAHDGNINLYRVSRSVIEADVFINLPKLKTHKKAGITCCLKNLVGINTYKNFLPHHSEGSAIEGGDQFAVETTRVRVSGSLLAFLKNNILKNVAMARLLRPLHQVGRSWFGDSDQEVRNGNWYGNDTIWRMILDLNKILLYSNPVGQMRTGNPASMKHYIGIVDAITAGQGNGPLAPDPHPLNLLIAGKNPVPIDYVCSRLMGFNPDKIPSIHHAFDVRVFPICPVREEEIEIQYQGVSYNRNNFPVDLIKPARPHFGWQGNIEFSAGD